MADAEEAAESPEEDAPEGGGPPGLVFLDPELDEEACAELAEALGCPVRVLPPDELAPSFPGPADRGIVVPFALPAQCGLDLVETVRLREHGREVPIAVADEQPTRSRVLAALRVGATSVALQPYDPEELKQKLAAALEAIASGDGEESADDDVSE